MVVNFALLFLADLLKQPDDELIVCVEEFFKFSFWNKGREFLKNVVQCSAVYFFVIWYCHYLLTFGNNARQVNMASFLPTNLEIILLTKNYNLFAGKSSKFRHKEILGFRS